MNRPTPALRPDTMLHIYYIEGEFPVFQTVADDSFIGNWVEDNFSFLFFNRPAKAKVTELLEQLPGLHLLDEYEMTYAQWQGDAIEPVRIGRFLLNPTWIKASPAEGEIPITLDSGVVFGNGAHTTTQACLEALDIVCMGKKPEKVLDLGCGTGILALAAAKLGCNAIAAVDYNYLAARTARTNVLLNRLEQHVVVVNIHYEVMKEIVRAEGFTAHKWFILSGLLASQAEEIVSFLHTLPVLILKRWNQDSVWHTILGITQQGGRP
jgi:ribosomal protein L11 methyltransferase